MAQPGIAIGKDYPASSPVVTKYGAWAAYGMVIAVAAAAWGGGSMVPSFVSMGLAGVAFMSRGMQAGLRAILLGIALAGQGVAFTAALAGHPFQLDSHMMFFALLAVVATMRSIWALLACVGIPMLVLPATTAQRYVRRQAGKARDLGAHLSTRLDEVFHGIVQVKLNALERYQARQYRTLTER